MTEADLRIADAILYEGYLLYPYRGTALKNRQRWHFGVLYPRGFCEREQANDAWMMQGECLVAGEAHFRVQVRVRFLHLTADGAVERDIALKDSSFVDLSCHAEIHSFSFPGLGGTIEISATPLSSNIHKFTVRTLNTTPFSEGDRSAALEHSAVSMHAMLTLRNGGFISAIDPPAHLQTLAAECRNVGLWPVLLGAEGQSNKMLAAPIILYDYPKIAPQSPGDHFDCTEIDEMLALRIDTLTDDEKRQMSLDARTRAILERTHGLSREQLSNLHGKTERQDSAVLKPGQRVRLRPSGRADIFDLALQGKSAVIESVECDFENRLYVTVTVEDDPGRDLGSAGRPGHRFFFRMDEVELL